MTPTCGGVRGGGFKGYVLRKGGVGVDMSHSVGYYGTCGVFSLQQRDNRACTYVTGRGWLLLMWFVYI
jgi:hypothetical protein